MMPKSFSPQSLARLSAATSPTGCTRPESLFGLWAIESQRFSEYVQIAKSVDLVALAKARADGAPGTPLPSLSPEKKSAGLYAVIDGMAMFSISGPMTKYETSFQDVIGGTATVPLRHALRAAKADPDVTRACLIIDSPGGTIAGMTELIGDIQSFKAEKPIFAFAPDLCASAALWAGTQCNLFYAGPAAIIGSIGAMAVLKDTSKKFAQEGITVHVVASDAPKDDSMKGAGVDGTPVTDAQLADFKRLVNQQNDLFVADVAAGRKLTPDRVRAMADGRVHIGAEAKALGLVDEISSFDAAMQAFQAADDTDEPDDTLEIIRLSAAVATPRVTAVEEWNAEIAAKCQSTSKPHDQIIAGVQKQLPGLHKRYLAETNGAVHRRSAAPTAQDSVAIMEWSAALKAKYEATHRTPIECEAAVRAENPELAARFKAAVASRG